MTTAFMALILPVKAIIIFLLILFTLNIWIGVSAGLNAEGEKFKLSKAFKSLNELIFYLVAVILLHFGLTSLGEPTMAQVAIK